ncbi:DUF1295 domain-containing protein [Desulfonatronovibrio magnus]|uniref:DUF1295 domain-containing protein n=1 Tax=Desulfonatronovibrio magnus TaxID=698827 RepID=UPI0005EB8B46|nr:DUF1295 domain-containing protein [Desulfonatronovibrio magnus]
MSIYNPLFLTLGASILLMICAWVLSLLRGKACVADSFWGAGFLIVAWIVYCAGHGYEARSLLAACLISIWGIRLCIHVSARNWGQPEDRRYQALRDYRGKNFWWVSLFTVFLLQAVLLWLVSLGVQLAQLSPVPDKLTIFDIMGALIWMTGFIIQVVGDTQLQMFKNNPDNKGRVMDQGLWGYSRHPNYFGESLMWWGLYLLVLQTPYALWAIISPLIITFLLLKVSGVAMTEQNISQRRPEYNDYQQRVSAFIPWFPKKR